MNTFREKIRSAEFVLSCEMNPPKGVDLTPLLSEAAQLSASIDVFNVTDSHSSVMRQSPLALCLRLKELGMDPVFQLTCRDRNRLALQSDLLAAAALGVNNVLALSGDHPFSGDHREAKAVFDLDSVQLLAMIAQLRSGRDMNGHPLSGPAPDFFAGAVVNPAADPLEPELIKMEKKISCGAEFFQTQAVFDAETFRVFSGHACGLGARLIAGVLPVRSARAARYLNEHVPGVNVPEWIIKRLQESGDSEVVAVDIFSQIIKQIRPFCAGIHFMPAGWFSVLPELFRSAGIRKV